MKFSVALHCALTRCSQRESPSPHSLRYSKQNPQIYAKNALAKIQTPRFEEVF
jgi:hypothetical protein